MIWWDKVSANRIEEQVDISLCKLANAKRVNIGYGTVDTLFMFGSIFVWNNHGEAGCGLRGVFGGEKRHSGVAT